MDDIRIWLGKVAEWVERCGPPAIPFAGQGGGGFDNPPRPHLELVCLLDGGFPELHLGRRRVAFPAGHISLHSVHHGNRTPVFQRADAWCVFLDVAGEPAFAALAQRPLFCLMPLVHGPEVVAAFARLATRCTPPGGGGGGGYIGGAAQYDARRDQGGPGARLRVQAALLDLLAVLLDEAGADGGGSLPLLPAALQAAVEHVGLHYADPGLTLVRLARQAGLGVDQFGRLFRHHLGETPMQHLRRVRITRSRFLLAHSGQRIEDVAFACGFPDQFHFSRVFRAHLGLSPLAFRRQAQPPGG